MPMIKNPIEFNFNHLAEVIPRVIMDDIILLVWCYKIIIFN